MALNKFYASNLVNQNQYKLKDKRALIYSVSTDGQDNNGFHTECYTPITENPIWCYTRQLTQNQQYEAHMLGAMETRLFVFNYRPGVCIFDKIKYREKWYEVTRVDTKDDYNGDLFVYVKDSEAPALNSIKEYVPTVWKIV